ncbi:CIA30 family protein [Oceanibium sediminis]|uniref:CIA30 family protein n=1 Tax=Oceanibium sediminis TaxID=2026339 RepID=UPI000DD42218|nr:CIA30 family protein [Oceanibium sediminis]
MELSPEWEYVADTVMGGVSTGRISRETLDGRAAVRLRGDVSLENNGGFVQMGFDLRPDGGVFDASAYAGVELDVRGNGEAYDLRLRTDQLTRPWHSFRASFDAPGHWTSLRIPFADLVPHRTDAAFDPTRLRRIGVLAIGREFQADVAVAAVRLYR